VNFTLTDARREALALTISEARLAPYLAYSEGDWDRAFSLYRLNAQLSESFYRPLQGLEIAVRNSLNRHFIARFGENWHEQTMIRLEGQQAQDVGQAIRDLQADGKPITNAAVVAELKFGFWVGVLGPRSEIEIWRKAAFKAFPHRGKGNERKAVQGALNSIRRLRNRVFHHERILHRDLKKDHETIIKVVSWICPETAAWVDAESTFKPEIAPAIQVGEEE
jgi:hypothetical protein